MSHSSGTCCWVLLFPAHPWNKHTKHLKCVIHQCHTPEYKSRFACVLLFMAATDNHKVEKRVLRCFFFCSLSHLWGLLSPSRTTVSSSSSSHRIMVLQLSQRHSCHDWSDFTSSWTTAPLDRDQKPNLKMKVNTSAYGRQFMMQLSCGSAHVMGSVCQQR